jgi:hypothetical protein
MVAIYPEIGRAWNASRPWLIVTAAGLRQAVQGVTCARRIFANSRIFPNSGNFA